MKNTITRGALTDALQREVGLPRDECARLLEDTIDAIVGRLAQCEPVKLTKFGSFEVRHKRERMGRNPKTGDKHPISSRNVVVFRPSLAMKRRIDRPS